MASTLPSNPLKRINLVRLAHVYYKHQDIDKARAFAADFGFEEAARNGARTYYRGYGTEPFVLCLEAASEAAFGGAAFVVESEEDLAHASKTLPAETKPSAVYDLTDAPGGGRCVTFYDPTDGFPFHLVHGQTSAEAKDPRVPSLKFNYPTEKTREGNTSQRFQKRPAPVHKLGHFGMCVTNFEKSYAFYTAYFNFFASELIHEDGKDTSAFFRLNRGDELVDHHCFFFFEGPRAPHVYHSSFEVHDLDTQVLGHDWLRQHGHRSCWGVGRHVTGSQIFDYWFDPSGFILEHYADGDLLDMTEPTHHTPASPDNLHIWGPDVPPAFLQ